jgi:hypothetical protein
VKSSESVVEYNSFRSVVDLSMNSAALRKLSILNNGGSMDQPHEKANYLVMTRLEE